MIAELGSTWRFGNDERGNVRRMIRAAKDCDANVAKMQWSSDGRAVAKRRGDPASGEMYAKYLEWPREWMQEFKDFADSVGIEWACTVFLPQDVAVIAPLVKRFKVAAKESVWTEFVDAHAEYGKPLIVSFNAGTTVQVDSRIENLSFLHCVSKYPCPVGEIALKAVRTFHGLSDHSAHVLTGAVAVGAGARVIESHIRLQGTPSDNPDYPHSLEVDYPFSEGGAGNWNRESYAAYVQNIRIAEKMI